MYIFLKQFTQPPKSWTAPIHNLNHRKVYPQHFLPSTWAVTDPTARAHPPTLLHSPNMCAMVALSCYYTTLDSHGWKISHPIWKVSKVYEKDMEYYYLQYTKYCTIYIWASPPWRPGQPEPGSGGLNCFLYLYSLKPAFHWKAQTAIVALSYYYTTWDSHASGLCILS